MLVYVFSVWLDMCIIILVWIHVLKHIMLMMGFVSNANTHVLLVYQ